MVSAPAESLLVLPGGRRLVVRPVEPSDLDGLTDLFERLAPDERHCRFFSASKPPRSFLERLVRPGERDAVGLVAVLEEDGRREVVGEAGYGLLPNGDGELGITVARRWRGWLGPYLFSVLLEAAHERGVPNLEADVLVTNGPMLALARKAGFVWMSHPDLGVVRLLVATGGPTPSWPPRSPGKRLIVEGAGEYWHEEDAARSAGFEVLVCPGPARQKDHCPVLKGEPCPLAARAGIIVMSHPGDAPEWQALFEAHRRLHRGVPLCVQLRANESPPAGVALLPRGRDPRSTVAVLERLVEEATRTSRAPERSS